MACCNNSIPPLNLVNDDVCGAFNIPCDGSSGRVPVYTNTLPQATRATVSVYLDSTCSTETPPTGSVAIYINGTDTPVSSVTPGNTTTFTVPTFTVLQLQCTGSSGTGGCIGRYCIKIHYPFS